MKEYETEHLILRTFIETDLNDNYTIMGDFDNIKYLLTESQTKEQCLNYINHAINKMNEEPCNEYIFAVVFKETQQVIGSCSLSIMDFQQGGLSSGIIHRDFQGKGYGSELIGFLLKLAFEELKLRRVIASCDTRNVPSYRSMEKHGMRREGHFIQGRSPSKREPYFFGDEYSYGILKNEYINKNKHN